MNFCDFSNSIKLIEIILKFKRPGVLAIHCSIVATVASMQGDEPGACLLRDVFPIIGKFKMEEIINKSKKNLNFFGDQLDDILTIISDQQQ
jgi:hypothetical protein